MNQQEMQQACERSCGDLEAVSKCADDAGQNWGGWSWPKRDNKRIAHADL
jgi:hypothetical protein